MPTLTRLSSLFSRDQFRPFARDYERIGQGSEKSIDSDPDDCSSRLQQSEPLLPEKGEQTKWNAVASSVESGKLIMSITAMLFLASLLLNIVVRIRTEKACLAHLEPWSKRFQSI